MAPRGTQYQHYIPRFVLRQFAYTQVITKRSISDGLIYVFDLPSGDCRLGEVGKTCGTHDLYHNATDTDPMRIEHLFSKLECKTSLIFTKISTAVASGLDHIDILEKDIHILFKFMCLAPKRTEHYRNEVKSPYRKNDFMFQKLFEDSRKRGRSGDPGQFWLEDLLYLLETDHEGLLTEAENTETTASAMTYKHFVDNYTLQIWRAADGHEFFINDRLVDFEGETQHFWGTEVNETGSQLIHMTTDDMIHLILPVNPEVAVIFCDESRCWKSPKPFADSLHRLTIPFFEISLLKDAPHKDHVNVHIPSERRGKKTWPATVAWRVNIGILSQHHHRIITSYSLSHAQSFIVAQHRGRFERAKRDCATFARERAELWESYGIRVDRGNKRQQHSCNERPTEAQANRIVDEHMACLNEVLNIVSTTREELERTKENAFKSWLGIRMAEIAAGISTSLPKSIGESSDGKSSTIRVMHPALKAAFEDAYPPKPADHRELVDMDFGEFFRYGLGEDTFADLSHRIDKRISELVHADNFGTLFSDSISRPPAGSLYYRQDENHDKQHSSYEMDILDNPSFQSIFRLAQEFDTMKWMFEERQDILVTFLQQIAVPMGSL